MEIDEKVAEFWKERGFEAREKGWYKHNRYKFSHEDAEIQYRMYQNGDEPPF